MLVHFLFLLSAAIYMVSCLECTSSESEGGPLPQTLGALRRVLHQMTSREKNIVQRIKWRTQHCDRLEREQYHEFSSSSFKSKSKSAPLSSSELESDHDKRKRSSSSSSSHKTRKTRVEYCRLEVEKLNEALHDIKSAIDEQNEMIAHREANPCDSDKSKNPWADFKDRKRGDSGSDSDSDSRSKVRFEEASEDENYSNFAKKLARHKHVDQ